MRERTEGQTVLGRLHNAYYAIPAGEPTTEQVMEKLPALYAAVEVVLSAASRIGGLLASVASAEAQHATIHVATEATCEGHLRNLNGYTVAIPAGAEAAALPAAAPAPASPDVVECLYECLVALVGLSEGPGATEFARGLKQAVAQHAISEARRVLHGGS